MRALRLLLCLSVLLPAGAPAAAGGPKVVATVLPVYVFAKNVAGDRAAVSLLIPPGTDLHGYSLKPLDAKMLMAADLVLLNGAGLEKNILSSPGSARAVDTSKGIAIIGMRRNLDPHVWLDPLNAVVQVRNIADALAAADPAAERHYRENAEAYARRLQALHERIAEGAARLASKRLITYHESFNYFARRYGLIAFSLTGPDAEAPLPRRVKAVYDIVRAESVGAVFREEQSPPGPLERLGDDLGVMVCGLSTIVSGEPSAELYERAMEANLQSMLRCLGTR